MAGNLTAMIASIFSGSAVSTDPYFNLTTLLLSTTATNGQQNNTFQDSSTNNFTITRNPATGPNAPTQGTFSPFSQTGWGNYFDGTGDYLSGNTNLWATTTSTFTVDGWVYPTSTPGAKNVLLGDFSPTGATLYIGVYINSSRQLVMEWYDGGTKTCTSTSTINLNEWSYVAVRVSSNAISMYVNSATASGLSGATTLTNRAGTTNWTIGQYASGNNWNGYISNLRMSTVARTIAIPTAPFTPDADTKLLTCQSNRFVDTSSNAYSVTPSSNTSVVPFSPFNPTSAWSASTVGGSGYFDGTGDYLNTPATGQFAPTGNFTIRLWFYLTSLAATNHLIGNYTANAATDWLIEVINTGVIQVFTNGSTLRLSHSGVTTNQWYYLTITRSGTTITGQVNGSNFNTTATYTQSGTFGSATKAIYIGQRAGSTNPLFGYLSSVSLVDGSALQTVPTAPLTNETGTQLLLNFTNAGIYDATAKNVLETVGDAQASTTITKWSPTSMKFDGTGDYAVTPASPLNAFLTGDFTCEFWVYFNALATNQTVMGTASGFQTGGYQWIQLASNTLTFRMELTSGAINVATGALSTGQWYHIAATRSGTTVRVFVNGVLANSTTTGGSISDSTGNKVIVGNTVELQATRFFNGYLQDVRVTRGYARYTANFTPPTAAFPVQ